MGIDFEFSDDGRRVQCTRGGEGTAGGGTGHASLGGTGPVDGGWWYVTVAGTAPVRLRAVEAGETRRDVWESALDYLDASA